MAVGQSLESTETEICFQTEMGVKISMGKILQTQPGGKKRIAGRFCLPILSDVQP